MSEQALLWPVYRLKDRDHPEYGDRLALVESLNTENLVALYWLPPHSGASLPWTADEIEEVGEFTLGNRMFPFDLEAAMKLEPEVVK